jgi:hypothetical protein
MAAGLLLLFLGGGSALWAAGAPAETSGTEDFGQFVAHHQADLAPFFEKNRGAFIGQGVPVLLEWLSRVMFVTLGVTWILDIALSRGFSALFAPALARLTRAVVYATGHLVLSLVLGALFSLGVVLVAGWAHLGLVLGLATAGFVVVTAVVQVGWILYLYRTDVFIAALFFLTLVVIHGFTLLGIAAPMLGAPASATARSFVDGTITPRLEEEIASAKAGLSPLAAARDDAATQVAQLQDQIDQDNAAIKKAQYDIGQQQNSPGYLFSRIMKVHAHGDLAAAQAQLTDFLAQFPDSPFTGLAKGQLTQVQSELAEQAEQKKQTEAAAAQTAAQARADLLARTARGEATLSQMRGALIGKSRDEVAALLGQPTETASNRWGYGRKMILNPLTGEKFGLAVYFSEGLVQGVDYYYGTGGTP